MLDNRKMADLVEDAWYERTKGELQIVPEYEGYDLHTFIAVCNLAELARWNIDFTGSMQFNRYDEEITADDVSDEEIARRIAAALDIVFYGGKA